MIRKMTALSVVLGVVLVSSAAIPQESPPVPKPTAAPAPEPLKIGKIENAFRLSPRLYSGGDPRGAEDFTALRKLGIKTIFSVDGSVPNV